MANVSEGGVGHDKLYQMSKIRLFVRSILSANECMKVTEICITTFHCFSQGKLVFFHTKKQGDLV